MMGSDRRVEIVPEQGAVFLAFTFRRHHETIDHVLSVTFVKPKGAGSAKML